MDIKAKSLSDEVGSKSERHYWEAPEGSKIKLGLVKDLKK